MTLNYNHGSTAPPPIETRLKGITTDDIDTFQWLSEVSLSQYTETFLVNLSKDGKNLARKRLCQVRQQDLSKMGIINYVHQKLLMEHITHVLKHPFNSPVRRKELKQWLAAHEGFEAPKESHEEFTFHNDGPDGMFGERGGLLDEMEVGTLNTDLHTSIEPVLDDALAAELDEPIIAE